MSRARPSVAALAAALAGAAILSCDRSPPPPALATQADAGAEIAPPASEASFHVQIVKSAQRLRIARGDEVLSPVAYRVLISGLSGEAGASVQAGFCRGLVGSGAGIGCSDGAKVAAGTIRVQLFSVGAASTARVSGGLSMSSGDPVVADLEFLASTASAPQGAGWYGALGQALANRWLTEVQRALSGADAMAAARPDAPAPVGLRWIGAPGMHLRDLWPLRDGASVPVADGVWTVQMSEAGELAAFLLDASGNIQARPRFKAAAADSPGAMRAWADHGAARLLVTLASADASVGGGQAPVVVALSRAGAEAIGELPGHPLGAAVAAADGLLFAPVSVEGAAALVRLPRGASEGAEAREAVAGARWLLPLPGDLPAPAAALVWIDANNLAVVVDRPHPAVYAIDIRETGRDARILWRWSDPEGRPALAPGHVPVIADGQGGAIILDASAQGPQAVVRVDGAGGRVWSSPMEGGARPTPLLMEGKIAVGGPDTRVFGFNDGAPWATIDQPARALADGGQGWLIACTEIGAAALDPRTGRKLKEIAFGRGCAALRALSDGGGFVGGETLSGVGLGPVSAW